MSTEFASMSIWWSDLDNATEETPQNGWYNGIFTTPPSLIASVLSRPLTPFLPYGDQETDEEKGIPCVNELLSNITPDDIAIGNNNPDATPPYEAMSVC
jgi:hypothetical protein